MNASDARKAHKILDDLIKGNMVLEEECEFLRSALPEQPRQMTLKEIHVMVNDYYTNESDAYGYLPVGGKHVRPWLNELRVQLYGLVRAQEDARESSPSLPEGMRLADHKEYGRCVASPGVTGDGLALILALNGTHGSGAMWRYTEPDALTFIEDPAKPTHPEFLETENSYTRAPRHTIVAHQGEHPWAKLDDGTWITTGMDDMDEPVTSVRLGEISRRVLRWGDGK